MLNEFVKLSKFAGERFDLIQAGGGNSSIKLPNGDMYIKASGCLLSEVEKDKNYAIVENSEVINILNSNDLKAMSNKKERDGVISKRMKSITKNSFKPSIETFLHSMLDKFTLHTHPIVVNMIVCQKNYEDILSKFIDEFLTVEYETPGFDLAIKLKDKLETYQKSNLKNPKIIFLQNHGLIVTSNSLNETIELTNLVLTKIEEYLNIDFFKYRLSNAISNYINSVTNEYFISYLSSDEYILKVLNKNRDLFFQTPLYPDQMVYCGIKALELNNLNEEKIKSFISEYGDIPKIIIYNDNVFFIAKNIKKAKEIEDVFKSHLMTLELKANFTPLLREELNYLVNWEAEKYRQQL